jgi:hypothetical protein
MKIRRFAFARKTGFIALLLLLNVYTAIAQKISYPDNWGSHGLTIKQQSQSGLSLNFSVKEFTLDDKVINGETMKEISLPGNLLQNDEGSPNLPSISRYIAIPQGATAQIDIIKSRTEEMPGIDIAPAPRIPMDTDLGPMEYTRNMAIYSNNALFPAQPVIISQKTQFRGVDVIMISVTPYQYNPVTKKLIVYRDIDIKVNFSGGNGHFGDDRLRSRFWDPILKDNVLNSGSLPEINYSKRVADYDNTLETGCEYLIIIPTDPVFKQWADSLKAFRTEQGILTKIVTITEVGGNTSAAIEAYINNAYNTWSIPPSACLLMADHGTNAATNITSNILNDHPDGYNPYISDNPYADVTGDGLPDIAFARMTANNFEQLETMVTKGLSYERNPPTDPDFYKHPVTALGWQTERWFQLCSEIVGGFWKNVLGKEPVRVNAVYQGTPGTIWSSATNTNTIVSYFGPNGLGYIPATPAELGGWDGGTATDINNALNAGAFMLQHRDHGMQTGWGEPSYTNSNINGLTNTDLSFIMSLNCQTGKFDYGSECFAEKFHRYKFNGQNAGALGLIAATEVSYSFVNDTYAWGMYDNMWTDFMPAYGAMFEERGVLPAFGNCAGKYFLQQSSWPYNTNNKDITYKLFHHHGDAFLTVFSEVPQQLTVSHAAIMISSSATFSVTANPGSFIALTANNQIIGTGVGTGSPVEIPVTSQAVGTIVKVVVTKQNYYRHYSEFLIIAPDGPYVITQSYTVNDAQGNNNQHLDCGEIAFLSLDEKNLGNSASENTIITLSLTDPYITLIDNSENYGTVPPQEVVTIPDGFKVAIANNVPNMHTATVITTATNGTDSWSSYITLECGAPVLSAGNLSVNDLQGGNGNGRLDPGETADIIIANINTGSVSAPDALGSLSLSSGFITLNNVSYNVGTINPLGSKSAVFNVTVNPATPPGLPVDLFYTLTSGAYTVQKTYTVQAGLIVEDWETGDFSKFNWTFGGVQPWTITTAGTYEGTYSAKSGTIGNSASSILILQYNSPQADSIKFTYKVSSEANKDYLKFYIDNIPTGSWTGTAGWEQVKYPLSAGSHTMKWVYSKDAAGSAGSDCAWLDFIILPVPQVTTSYAGADGFVCENSSYQCAGNAANYSTVNWSTSGTGVFNSTSILNPVYSPSAADIAAGSVTLTLDVSGVSGTSTDNMLLQIQQPATANAGSGGTLCAGDSFSLSGATASNYTQLTWTSSGTGTFDNANSLNPVYISSVEDGLSGDITLTLHASNQACAASTSSVLLTVRPMPNPFVTGDFSVCEGSTDVIYSTPLTEGNTYEWLVEGGTITEGEGTNSIKVNWVNSGTGMISLLEKSPFDCSSLLEHPITIHEAPAPEITGADSYCKGETGTLSTAYANAHSYSWDGGGATITSGQNTNEVTFNWENAGTYTISVLETILSSQCSNSDSYLITVNTVPFTPALPLGPTEVDLYKTGTSDYTITGLASNAYTWQLLPSDAGIVAGNGLTATVTWNSSFRGDATLAVKSSNNCGESNWSDAYAVHVMNSLGIKELNENIGISLSPNPNNGEFKLAVTTKGKSKLSIKIINAVGAVVYKSAEINTDGKYSEAMKLNLESGTYSIIVVTANGSASQKFVVK